MATTTIKGLILIELSKIENKGYIIARFHNLTDKENPYDGLGEYVEYSIDSGVLNLKAEQYEYFIDMSNVMLKVNK